MALEGVPVAAEPSREDVVAGFLSLLFERGPEAIPPAYRRAVLAEAWRRIEDPETGFLFFWLNLAHLHIKGKGYGGVGWQRACPGGKPRRNKAGRSWEWQAHIAAMLPSHPLLLILKARQIGFTYLLANFVIWCCISAPEQIIAVVANKMQSSKRLLRRALQVYNRLPDWVKDHYAMVNPALSHMEFANGSFVEPYSGDPDAARGDAASRLIADEIGEFDRLDDWWSANESVADGGGQMVMFGTAKDNGIEQWCDDCDKGDELTVLSVDTGLGEIVRMPVMRSDGDMDFIFVPDNVHPDRTDEWRGKAMKRYRGNLSNFDREHPLNWRDAFTGVGRAYFNEPRLKEVSAVARELFEARDRRGTLLASSTDPTDVRFVEDPFGHVVIHASETEFAELLAQNRAFVIGADCAGDRATGDYHAASGVQKGDVPEFSPLTGERLDGHKDIVPHRQLLTIHGHFDGDEYAELLMRAGYLLGSALIGVEANGVGGGIIRYLRRRHYPNIYRRRTKPTKKGDKPMLEYGWWSTAETKGVAYGELERCLRNGWTDIRDMATLVEMRNVVSLGGGKIGAREPKHDDNPDGLAIAHAMMPYARVFAGTTVSEDISAEPEYGTMAWLLREFDERDRLARTGLLGHNNDRILAG